MDEGLKEIAIRYDVRYRYAEAVSFSRHLVRLLPRQDHATRLVALRLETNAGADIQYRNDMFDNPVASCFYPETTTDLIFHLTLRLEIGEKNPFHFLIDSHAVKFPFSYTDDEKRLLSAYLHQSEDDATPALPFWSRPEEPVETIQMLSSLNSALFRHIRYERREEGAARLPAETLALGSGACRDTALLMACTLRRMGCAARLASGYLCEFDAREKRAEGALHAWTEVFLPGAGWTGLDPTNGVWCDHNFITAAVGITPEDVTPVLGNYFSDHSVPSSMEASLSILPA